MRYNGTPALCLMMCSRPLEEQGEQTLKREGAVSLYNYPELGNNPFMSRLSRLTDRDFYATVFRPAFASIVAVDGVGLAFTPGRDLAAIHTRARQIVGGSARAPLRQLLVVRLGADRVGVTDDFHAVVRAAGNPVCDPIQPGGQSGLDVVTVESEETIGLDRNGLRRRGFRGRSGGRRLGFVAARTSCQSE